MSRSKGLMPALAIIATIAGLPAREREEKSLKVAGIVSQVETSRISIATKDGTEENLLTRQDFSNEVAVGSPVTAWYVSEGGSKHLTRLEHPLETFFLSAHEIRRQVKKVVLLPSSSVPDADGVFDSIAKYLELHSGWYVAPRELAEEIRDQSGKPVSLLDAMDPMTGEFDMTKYVGGDKNLIVHLASETRVDAVLEVRVEEVTAKVRRLMAAWDGVEQLVSSKGPRTIAKLALVPERGEVAASTVVLKLWSPQGKPLWSHRRGFAALAVLPGTGGKFRYRALPEFLGDSAAVEKWLSAVFGSLLSVAPREKAVGNQ